MDLITEFDKIRKVPYIISGGAGSSKHVLDIINNSDCSGVAIGSAFHYGIISVKELKSFLNKNNIELRR